jgi:hypothetical protein
VRATVRARLCERDCASNCASKPMLKPTARNLSVRREAHDYRASDRASATVRAAVHEQLYGYSSVAKSAPSCAAMSALAQYSLNGSVVLSERLCSQLSQVGFSSPRGKSCHSTWNS